MSILRRLGLSLIALALVVGVAFSQTTTNPGVSGIPTPINNSGGFGITFTTTGTTAVTLPTSGTLATTTQLPPAPGPLANSLSGDVSLSNTGTYFVGPTVAQGVTGTWWASGTVTVADTGIASEIDCKLWDGTTVISSGSANTPGANLAEAISLSGFIASPAGNIRISCKDATATTGRILFNFSGNSKDSTLSVFRIL